MPGRSHGGGGAARRAAAASAGVERGVAGPPGALRAAAERCAGRAGVGAAGPQRAVLGGGARPVLVSGGGRRGAGCGTAGVALGRPVLRLGLLRVWRRPPGEVPSGESLR